MNTAPENITFRIDKSFKVTIAFGLIFFGGGLILSLILPFFMKNIPSILLIWMPVIIGYCIYTKIFIEAWRHRNDVISLNGLSISTNSKKYKNVIIKWNEITEIEEHNILGRFTVVDINRNTLRLEYQIDKISELLNKIYESIPHLIGHFSQIRYFYRTKHHHIVYGMVLLFFIFLLILSLDEKYIIGIIMFSIFVGLIIYLLLIEFVKLYLVENGVLIRYPLWKRKILYSEIDKISLEMSNKKKGKTSPCVILFLKNNRKIRLDAVKEGTVALYAALNYCLSTMTS